MSGSILQRARLDAKRYVTSGGFEETMTLTPVVGLPLTFTGYATKHWISLDSNGLPVNGKNAHVCVDESILIANNYPYRNAKGEVMLKRHKVDVQDSTGIVKNYVVDEQYPDETLGLIVLILGDYKT